MGSIWQSTGLFIFEEVSLSLKVGGQTLTFLLKVPPKMKASKMCRVRVFFSGWEMATIIISGTWWRLSTDMRYFLSFHISVPFGAHFLLKHLHVKGKNGQRFRLVICSRPLFQPFSEEKRVGNFSSWTQKYYFLTEIKVLRFIFSIKNQHVILFTRNVVQYSLKSISQENICYGPRSMTLRPTECDSFFYFNQLRDFVAPLQ